jgi:hypothetical protein
MEPQHPSTTSQTSGHYFDLEQHKTEGKPAVSDAVRVTYLPHDGDNDETEIAGVKFVAGDPVELDMSKHAHQHAFVVASQNPFFHLYKDGDEAPQSPKAKAIAERASERLVHLKEIVADFEAGKVTHAHGDRLKAIADAIQESAR